MSLRIGIGIGDKGHDQENNNGHEQALFRCIECDVNGKSAVDKRDGRVDSSAPRGFVVSCV